MVRHPEGESGWCEAIVQPQDIFSTVLAMAGVRGSEGIESFDVLRTALGQAGRTRRYAMSGMPANPRLLSDPKRALGAFFEGEWYIAASQMSSSVAVRILR